MNNKISKPIPYALSQYGSCTEILYKCINCGTDFRILGDQEQYCHGCGMKQDWSDSPKYCSHTFKQKYDELVYKHYAYLHGEREQDKELVQLFYKLYKGEIK